MAAKKISTLTIDLQANANAHNAQMDKARTKVRQYATDAKAANDASHKMADGFSTAANQASVIYGPLSGISGRLSAISAGLRAVGAAGFVGAAGLSIVATGIVSSLAVYQEWEQRQLRMQGLLKATGNASGLTADQLDNLARSVALNTLGSVEGVGDAIGVLLTFKTVQQDVFTRAIELSGDLAAVMGTDAKSAATQLGKALEDPAAGLNALKRSGVSFSETEKEVIKDLQETNRLAEAQKFILDKLADQVGGAGSSEASGLAGALDTLGQRYDEFLFDLAETTRLGEGATWVINKIAQGVRNFNQDLFPDDKVRLNELATTRLALKKEIQEMNELGGLQALPSINPLGYSKNDWYNAQREYSSVTAEMLEIQQRGIDESKKQSEAAKAAARARAQFEREQAAAREKAEQERLAKQQAREAERLRQKLLADQRAGALFVSQLDAQFADEGGRLDVQHQQRLIKIEALQLSEQEVRARGYESLQQLQADYALQAEVFLERQQQAREQKALEAELREQQRLQSDVEQIRQSLVDKDQLELEAWQRRQTRLAEWFIEDLTREQEYLALSQENWRQYQNAIGEQNDMFWQSYAESVRSTAYDTDQFWANALTNFSQNTSNAVTAAIFDWKGVGDLVGTIAKSMAKSMVGALVEIATQRMVLWALEKTVLAGSTSGYVAQVSGQAASQVAMAGLNAFTATAAIPFIGPALAPAAATAATAAASPMAVAAITAATSSLAGMAHSGIDNIPKEGTWLLDGGERVVAPEQNRDLTRFLSQQKAGGSVPGVQIINNGPPASAQASMLDDGTLQIILEAVDGDQAEKTARGTGLAAQAAERTYGLNRAMGVG